MSVAAERIHTPAPTSEQLPNWPRSKAAIVARVALQRLLLLPLTRWLCRPLRIEGRTRLSPERGPFLFVANHASHADTAAILAALPARLRRRTAPAAAEDYFFRGRIRGALTALAFGAFPFPRRGGAGLARAEQLLAAGWSVVLFPEGTRCTGNVVTEFKVGAGILASRGATVVPIGIDGTAGVLPKKGRLPRQAPVSVVFGEPVRFDHMVPGAVITARLRSRVSRLRAAARLLRPAPRAAVYDRARALARSRAGLIVVFCWGVAEALAAPIVPDVGVALLALAAPGRFLVLAVAATAGSLAGGAVAYGLGTTGVGGWLLAHAPLVTDRMRGHSVAAMQADGAGVLFGQPWSGIPYKVFGYQSAGAGVGFAPYLWGSLLGRGFRIVVVGAAFASAAAPFVRWLQRWARCLYGPFAGAFGAVFAMGLARVVASWS